MRSSILKLILTAIQVTAQDIEAEEQTSPMERLWGDVIERHNPYIRPVYNNSNPITIHQNIQLYQILEVNERQQYIKLNMWVSQVYRNEYLGWDPAAYNNIHRVEVPPTKLWIPDIYVYNSLDFDQSETRLPTNSWVVTKNMKKKNMDTFPNNNQSTFWGGAVATWYPIIGRFNCQFNTKYFPYDQQKCSIIFRSWSYPMELLKLRIFRKNVDLSSFIPSEEWNITTFTMRIETKRYSCCPTPYAVLVAELVMMRKPLYYVINIILPTVVIAQVAFMGFFSGGGGERSERVGLGMDTLVAMSILLIIVSNLMPITSSYIPMTGLLIFSVIIMTALSVVATCVINTFYDRKDVSSKVPGWVRETFFRLGPWLFVAIPPSVSLSRNKKKVNQLNATAANALLITSRLLVEDQQRNSAETNIDEETMSSELHSLNDRYNFVSNDRPNHYGFNDSPSQSDNSTALLQKHILELQAYVLDVKRYLTNMDVKMHFKDVNEWITLAKILDRIMLILFSATLWSTTIYIMFFSHS